MCLKVKSVVTKENKPGYGTCTAWRFFLLPDRDLFVLLSRVGTSFAKRSLGVPKRIWIGSLPSEEAIQIIKKYFIKINNYQKVVFNFP